MGEWWGGGGRCRRRKDWEGDEAGDKGGYGKGGGLIEGREGGAEEGEGRRRW